MLLVLTGADITKVSRPDLLVMPLQCVRCMPCFCSWCSARGNCGALQSSQCCGHTLSLTLPGLADLACTDAHLHGCFDISILHTSCGFSNADAPADIINHALTAGLLTCRPVYKRALQEKSLQGPQVKSLLASSGPMCGE